MFLALTVLFNFTDSRFGVSLGMSAEMEQRRLLWSVDWLKMEG